MLCKLQAKETIDGQILVILDRYIQMDFFNKIHLEKASTDETFVARRCWDMWYNLIILVCMTLVILDEDLSKSSSSTI